MTPDQFAKWQSVRARGEKASAPHTLQVVAGPLFDEIKESVAGFEKRIRAAADLHARRDAANEKAIDAANQAVDANEKAVAALAAEQQAQQATLLAQLAEHHAQQQVLRAQLAEARAAIERQGAPVAIEIVKRDAKGRVSEIRKGDRVLKLERDAEGRPKRLA